VNAYTDAWTRFARFNVGGMLVHNDDALAMVAGFMGRVVMTLSSGA
jgi:hypothetical protein